MSRNSLNLVKKAQQGREMGKILDYVHVLDNFACSGMLSDFRGIMS